MAKLDLTGFLLETGWGDQTSLGGWWRMRKLIRFEGDQIMRVRDS